jgi:hypothetical protein
LISNGNTEGESVAFTQEEIQAASSLSVSMPPSPKPPITQIIAQELSTATHSKGEKSDAKILASDVCTGAQSSDFECYQSHYQDLVHNSGIDDAFADLKARYPNNSYVQSQCHPLTHVIGRTAAESFNKVSDAYQQGDSYCWSGYFHGVLEAFAHKIGLTNLRTQINSMCADLNTDGKYGFDYYNCVHGIGHGLMAVTDDELFDSLGYCDGLTGDWEQQSCAGGVYMENIIADGLNHVTKYLDPEKPLYPCSGSPDKYQNSCYLMQTSYMLKINGGDFAKTFQWCRDAGAFQDTCNQSLGRDASGRSVSDGQKTKDICMLGPSENEKNNCVIGAVKDFISYFHSDVQAKAFCNLFDGKIQTDCLSTTEWYYKSF